MCPHAFDRLARGFSRPASRRRALASLLGGALLLEAPAVSEAVGLRTIEIQVDNTKGKRAITVIYGATHQEINCCSLVTTATIPAGHHRRFDYPIDGFTTGFVYINNKYWFQFHNPGLGRPFVQIALNGSFHDTRNPQVACCLNCCYLRGIPWGTTVEYLRTFAEGQTRSYNIENTALFTVRRHTDLKHRKFFTVTPPTL